MTQLDRIEAKLDELTQLLKSDKLARDMREAVAAANAIKAQQEHEAAVQFPEDDPGVSREPVVSKVTATEGKVQKHQQPPDTAEHRPDMTGGVPAVKAGKPDPASPRRWAGVPQWEEGRQPRIVESLLKRAGKKT